MSKSIEIHYDIPKRMEAQHLAEKLRRICPSAYIKWKPQPFDDIIYIRAAMPTIQIASLICESWIDSLQNVIDQLKEGKSNEAR
jgi:Iap family predicted aminopeptidase